MRQTSSVLEAPKGRKFIYNCSLPSTESYLAMRILAVNKLVFVTNSFKEGENGCYKKPPNAPNFPATSTHCCDESGVSEAAREIKKGLETRWDDDLVSNSDDEDSRGGAAEMAGSVEVPRDRAVLVCCNDGEGGSVRAIVAYLQSVNCGEQEARDAVLNGDRLHARFDAGSPIMKFVGIPASTEFIGINSAKEQHRNSLAMKRNVSLAAIGGHENFHDSDFDDDAVAAFQNENLGNDHSDNDDLEPNHVQLSSSYNEHHLKFPMNLELKPDS